MTIKLTFEFDTLEKAAEFLRRMGRETTSPQTTFPEEAMQPAPPPPKKRAKKADPAPTPESAPAASAPTQGDAQAALEKLFSAKGMEICREVMSRYGVQRLKDMKSEQYADFIQHAEKVLAGGEA